MFSVKKRHHSNPFRVVYHPLKLFSLVTKIRKISVGNCQNKKYWLRHCSLRASSSFIFPLIQWKDKITQFVISFSLYCQTHFISTKEICSIEESSVSLRRGKRRKANFWKGEKNVSNRRRWKCRHVTNKVYFIF